jgi:hypothetical protein
MTITRRKTSDIDRHTSCEASVSGNLDGDVGDHRVQWQSVWALSDLNLGGGAAAATLKP